MNYMVFDLEFNQIFNFSKDNPRKANPRCPFEIIHIGAVKLDEKLNTIGTFDRLVKPKLYTRIHPFVKKMTGITRESLKTAEPFEMVYEELSRFMRGVDVLCIWGGSSDINELFRNIKYHKLDTSIIPKKYIDVQHYANKNLKKPKGISVSLQNAVEAFNIPLKLNFHNAFNDAFYTAKVFKELGNKNIVPKIYTPPINRNLRLEGNKRASVDTGMLIKQFDKLYHREMTPEEQSIIKSAYKMGSTHQFLK